MALLSVVVGISLAAAMKFSKNDNLLHLVCGNKKGREDLTSHPIADRET